MTQNSKWRILNYSVPIIALMVIALHFILASTTQLSSWKGGGFGMYTDVHYYYNELTFTNLNKPFDSILKQNRKVAEFTMDVKRFPSTSNLKRIAELVSEYATNDTIIVQMWKPLIDAKAATYSRELINQYQYIKP